MSFREQITEAALWVVRAWIVFGWLIVIPVFLAGGVRW